ncbi:MAG: PASTA domain-containing protein [Prevotella sp.]|nr:PASTA domain-containing protein [Prevotella sp.]
MKVKEFLGKLVGRYLLLNLLAMVLVVVLLCVGVKWGLNAYTRHGQEITLPNLYGMDYKDALVLLDQDGLLIEANDTGYNKRMAADCILMQNPAAGTHVKEGRTVYVTINSTRSPMVALPDVIDNSSYRQAQAHLTAIGFRLLPPKRIEGDYDWVYRVECGGRELHAGEMVSIESPLTLVIGGTLPDEAEDEDMLEWMNEDADDGSDDFEEVGIDD